MKKFLKNSFVDVSVKGDSHIIDIFSGASGKKKIVVSWNSHLTYLIVAKNATLDLHIDIQWQHAFCQIFALFISGAKPTEANILTHIVHSSVKAEKYIVSLLWDGGKVSIDANIDIKKWVKQVTAHLLEENVVLGKDISVKSLPALSVASHDVHASHGAKIEKINQEKLFYMQSRWLSEGEAQTLVIDGYVNALLSHFEMFSDKELSVIRDIAKF